jgi:hypothetical protein
VEERDRKTGRDREQKKNLFAMGVVNTIVTTFEYKLLKVFKLLREISVGLYWICQIANAW